MKQRTVNEYLKEKYGKKLYKVSINAGFSCPNRDGTLERRGCIFCSEGGSGEFAGSPAQSITEQIGDGKKRVLKKLPKGDFGLIAYFQAFTNTYAPVDTLRRLYFEALRHPEVEILSIATRPDCLSDEVLELLAECNRIKTVWVELGLQTVHERTAKYIRRGYDLSVYDAAVRRLRERGLETIVHVILGLPGESREDMLQTVEYVGKSGATGIKLQLLHVLKNTDLAKEYEAGKFECLSMEEYVSLVKDACEVLPDNIVIHRMTGDGDKKLLIAPTWSEDKKRVLNALRQFVIENQDAT
ncbi:MAG: TIGR01212 family radical SAM protein [Lachnospiraceae bacterium]|nr:TIGR01212 family radical SAM protein [Lachnospiraceae bacterium]